MGFEQEPVTKSGCGVCTKNMQSGGWHRALVCRSSAQMKLSQRSPVFCPHVDLLTPASKLVRTQVSSALPRETLSSSTMTLVSKS